MIITEYVEVKITVKNREWFIEKGYVIPDNNKLSVKPLDLTKGSHTEIQISCDYCNKELKLKAKDFFKQRAKTSFIEDVCNDCGYKKSRKNNKIKYGIENPMHMESSRENLKNTMLDKYGVENASYIQEVVDKRKETCLENFGVESYFMTDKFKEERKKNNILKYGTEWAASTQEFQEKRLKTLFEKGTTPSSSQQNHIHNLIGGTLNLPVGASLLDIAFEDEKIYVEYDGGGHDLNVKLGRLSQDDFNKKEQRRSFYLLDNGWREIRIVCESDKLPSDIDIVNFIDLAKQKINDNLSRFIKWEIDTNTVTISNKNNYSLEEFLQLEGVA